MVMASIYIMAGDYDNAIDKLDYLLSIPSFVSANELKLDPFYEPLWNLPRFKEMIARHENQSRT